MHVPLNAKRRPASDAGNRQLSKIAGILELSQDNWKASYTISSTRD